jgi:hypothetical protein
MKKIDFSFLEGVQLRSSISGIETAITKGMIVKRNGKLLISENMLKHFLLEENYGFDVFTSKDWGQIDVNENILFAAIVPTVESKIDVLGYNHKGRPAKAEEVYEVPPSKGGSILYSKLVEVFNGEPENGSFHIYFDTKYQMVTPNNVYYIPKTFSKGANAGQPTYVRRENINVYPINLVDDSVSDTFGADTPGINEKPAEKPKMEIVHEREIVDKPKEDQPELGKIPDVIYVDESLVSAPDKTSFDNHIEENKGKPTVEDVVEDNNSSNAENVADACVYGSDHDIDENVAEAVAESFSEVGGSVSNNIEKAYDALETETAEESFDAEPLADENEGKSMVENVSVEDTTVEESEESTSDDSPLETKKEAEYIEVFNPFTGQFEKQPI